MQSEYIKANKEEIASLVLMSEDSIQAKIIASTFLENIVEFNHPRMMVGYTGYFQDIKITIIGSGLGITSMGAYSYELYHDYGVETIVHIAGASALTDTLKLGDLLLVSEAYSSSNYARVQNGNEQSKLYSTKSVNEALLATFAKEKKQLQRGCVHTSEVVYTKHAYPFEKLYMDYGCIAQDYESFSLFQNANACKKQAACVLYIKDSYVDKNTINSKDFLKVFDAFVRLILQAMLSIKENKD